MTATDLNEFLARQTLVSTSHSTWPGPIELTVSGYLSAEAPPAELVSSVRAIVLKADSVLVMRNLDSTNILPGGRVEKGETHEGILRREVLKEAGVEIEVLARIGLMHLKHTTPKPKDYPYSYPDFLWPIYAASFAGWRLDAKVEDGYEVSSGFLPIHEVRTLGLEDQELAFLDAAIDAARTPNTLTGEER